MTAAHDRHQDGFNEDDEFDEAAANEPEPIRRRRLLFRVIAAVLIWLLLGAVTSLAIFPQLTRDTEIAGQYVEVSPRMDPWVMVHMGPVLPNLRIATGRPIGLDIIPGSTEATSWPQIAQRYAFVATNPQGPVNKLLEVVDDLLLSAVILGFTAALAPVGLWFAIGIRRRREIVRTLRQPRYLAGILAFAVALGAAWWALPIRHNKPDVSDDWVSLNALAGPEAEDLPDFARKIQIERTLVTDESRRLVLSAVSTYQKSQTFYQAAAEAAATLEVHQPDKDETVAVLVSDRHLNVGMDPVVRAIANTAGATAILDAGDDTSTGAQWETFSLDSINAAFKDFDRWAVAGNHDSGGIVGDYLGDRGWTRPTGRIQKGPGGSTMVMMDDPRASGLGNWRDEGPVSFSEAGVALADAACEAKNPIGTLLVHDANLGRAALRRGCADLVVGGHVHVVSGPDEVIGDDGHRGYTFTNGTTGGAAYAIAVGSKPRRTATCTLITYRDKRPVGIQVVQLETNGALRAGPYRELAPGVVPTPESDTSDAATPSATSTPAD